MATTGSISKRALNNELSEICENTLPQTGSSCIQTRMPGANIIDAFKQVPWVAASINRPGLVCRAMSLSNFDPPVLPFGVPSNRIYGYPIMYATFQLDTNLEKVNKVMVFAMTCWRDGDAPLTAHNAIALGFQVLLKVRGPDWHPEIEDTAGELAYAPRRSWEFEGLHVAELHPIRSPDCLLVTVTCNCVDHRRTWLSAQVKQYIPEGEDDYGREILCAKGQAQLSAKAESKLS